MITQILPLLLASMMMPQEDIAAVESKAAAIFAPYKADDDDTPSWERTIYSEETAALIAHWQEVLPEDEPDELNDGDWFCQCQDWDHDKFSADLEAPEPLTEDMIAVKGKIDLGFGEGYPTRAVRLVFKREGDDWRLDEMTSESFPNGLKQALRETIAADEARQAEAKAEP